MIMKKRYINFLKIILYVALALAALCVVVPVFICDRFRVNGPSMNPTLETGEYVYVNKLIMGARIYKKYDFSNPTLSCFRMPGLRKIRPDDIAVFNYPEGYDRKKIEFRINYVYAKRCIACPGDTVRIVNGFYRNSSYPEITFGSRLKQEIISACSESELDSMNVSVRTIPYGIKCRWTVKDFGPMYIPGRGDVVLMDSLACRLYRKEIEYETGFRPQITDGQVYLGETPVLEYRFTSNWYFFGGDNVLNSKDSRYIGLVPEDYIIGVVNNPSVRNFLSER